MSKTRPNIVVILTDQQRYDTVHALGNPVIRTPALDRLANEGAAFTRCYTPSPVCVPARAALASGLPPCLNGCADNGMPIDPSLPSFMDKLYEAGYQTHGVGKMHFTPTQRMWGFENRDFSEEGAGDGDDFVRFVREQSFGHVDDVHGVRSEMYYMPQPSQLPDRLHHTRWVADRSIEFLKRRDRKRPFLLCAHWIKPHPPFENPTPWNKLYRVPQMLPPFRPEGFEQLHTYWNKAQNRYKYYDQGYDALRARAIKAAYYGCISYIDYHVARLLEALGDEIDNTLIIYSSDHGELLGDYGCVGKRCMLDPAVRVPMLVRYPARFAAGGRCDEPTSLLDVWPTALAAAGVEEPRVCEEGHDLADVASGRVSDRTVYSQFQHKGYALHMAASRHGKYIYSAADQREWFFDRTVDPHETRNGSGSPSTAQVEDSLRQGLITRLAAAGAPGVEGDEWRKYPVRDVPMEPDAGLLFQDRGNLQERIDALGPGYARKVTASSRDSIRMLRTPE